MRSGETPHFHSPYLKQTHPGVPYLHSMKLPALALTFTLCLTAAAQDSLLVLSKRDHTLAVVDASTLKVLEKFPS
jgi:hypothetical protein